MFRKKESSGRPLSVGIVNWMMPSLAILLLISAPSFAADKAENYAVNSKFNRDTVVDLARNLAASPYSPPKSALPDSLKSLSYDEYRDIQFDPTQAVWANEGLPFEMQMFHRGAYYKDPVEVAIVEDGTARHLAYSPTLFKTGDVMTKPLPTDDIGFAGFNLHSPINRPDFYDETVVFQGASYFRALGKNEVYGLSARGLALKTADPEGEEFPIYRAFWIEKPSKESNSIVIYALLDSQSVTGAYRFTIRPGTNTTMDVEATLFPRVDLSKIGLAPESSMYLFSANGRQDVDDFRPEVHDSDGLLMVNGRGERLWRPLANPKELQISAFQDTAPLGFGLMQRDRDFNNYQDLEAEYQQRPSLWVEPVGNWGKGAVVLTEIPSSAEIHDNIIAYWAPTSPITAGSEYSFAYRLTWGQGPQIAPGEARVESTRSGKADGTGNKRLFVVDYTIPNTTGVSMPANRPQAMVKASKGSVSNVVVRDNPQTGGYRVSFELDPTDADLVELRMELKFDDGRKAETWMYRWTN